MSASQNNLSLVINQQDTNGVNIVNRLIGAIEYAGVDGQFTIGSLSDTNAHAQTFPSMITTAVQYYLKNTSTTAQEIRVTWTTTGGASALVQELQAGGVIVFWNTLNANGAGVTAISLQADIAGATFEQFIGG